MNERIRIDSADVARAPAAESGPQSLGNSMPVSSGDVFGKVSASQATQMGPGSGGIWAKPKLMLSLAGLVAAIIASILTDGIGGYGRYEAAGQEPPAIIALLLMCSFSSCVTMFIAAVDDLAVGAWQRAALFGALGFIGGLVAGVVALVAGGIVMMLIAGLIFAGRTSEPHGGELVFLAVLMRAPAWLCVGALSGFVVGALGRSWRRALLGAIGGACGGLLGGLLFDPINFVLFNGAEPGTSAWASRLIALMATGSATGFAIAYAEQAAKQAWLAIERGRLIGKQFIIYRNPTRIGASYSNDVFLFKDTSVQQEHARILRRGGSYVVEALSGALLRVNGQPTVSRALSNGDTLQVGETVMRFNTKS